MPEYRPAKLGSAWRLTLLASSIVVAGLQVAPLFGSDVASAATTVAIPTPAKSAAVAALLPTSVRTAGSVTFAEDATYAPDEFIASNGHTIIGMDADLATALASVMGLKANLVNATFNTIIPGLQSGKYQVGLSSFTITPARAKVVNFVSYFKAGEGFYAKSSSTTKVNGLGSLCGLTVSVESGTTEQSDAQSQNTTCKKDKKSGVTVLSFADQNSANLAVSSGRAAVGFADSQVAAYIVKQSSGAFKLSGSAIEVAPYGIAFPKTSTLDKATQAALKVLISDGIYAKILNKWGLATGGISNPVIS
jgi:polar amino acid transport system substrate-binding protein